MESPITGSILSNEKNRALFHANSGAIAYLRVERYAMHSRHAMTLRALKTRYFTLFGAIRYSA